MSDLSTKKASFIAEARKLLALFQDPVWAQSECSTDSGHVGFFENQLGNTREHFKDMSETTVMNLVMGEGNVILAITGNSPESDARARAIVGFLQTMPYLLNEIETNEKRIKELLESNNEKLLENRAQRRTIADLRAREKWLLEKISGELLKGCVDDAQAPEDDSKEWSSNGHRDFCTQDRCHCGPQ